VLSDILVGLRIWFHISSLDSMEQDHPPCRSFHLLKLPLHFESLPKFPSKRRKVNRRRTYISTSQTCGYPVMGIEWSPKHIGNPSTHIHYVVNGTPSTP
jgi:hypothetical protein